jgi:MFS family permease
MLKKLSLIYKDTTASPFLFTIVFFGIAAGLFSGVFNNYMHDVLSIGKAARGIIEFPREAPGFLLIVFVALFYRLNEERIFSIALLFTLAGLVGISFLGENRWFAIVMMVLWSCGEHIMMPVRDSIGIHMAHKGKEGLALGSISSIGNIGQLIGFYLVPVLIFLFPVFIPVKGTFPYYQAVFWISVIFCVTALIFSFRVSSANHHIKRERFYFNKKYNKYYGLEMFFGARKQVFITFAPYVLIVNYGMTAQSLSLLYGITSTLNIFIGPMTGRLIDKLGFRFIIICEAIILMVLCFLYGFSQHFVPHHTAYLIICGVFIMDSILFAAGMARSLYARSISDTQKELTATLSTGISINHLISIIIALVGGFLWEKYGVEVLFSVSGFFGLCYLFFAFTLPKHGKPPQISADNAGISEQDSYKKLSEI